MERAVPSIIREAASRSKAFRSLSLSWAISRTCCRLTLPTFSLLGLPEPFSIPAAFLSRTDVGGVLVTKMKLRSSKMVMATGITCPAMEAVRFGPRANEAGHPGGAAHHVPGLVRHGHVDQDVPRVGPLGDVPALPILDLDHVLGGNQHIEDLIVHVHRLDPFHQVVAYLLFVTGIGVHHVPVGFALGSRRPGPRHDRLSRWCLGRCGAMAFAHGNPLTRPYASGFSGLFRGRPPAPRLGRGLVHVWFVLRGVVHAYLSGWEIRT